MSMPVQITDGRGSGKFAHLHQKRDDVGTVTYTHPLREYTTTSIPFFNANKGVEMAINAGFSGTPEEVHDGTDNAYWTGSQIIGAKVTFTSTGAANSGTKSVLVDNPSTNDTWQFAKGSDLTVSSYTAITMYINVEKDWSLGESIDLYGWDTGLAIEVGTRVALEDYFSELDFNVWHKLVIPLSSMGLTSGTIDALRMEMVGTKVGKNPKLYIDDIQIEEVGTPVEYRVTPALETILHMTELRFNFIDAYDATLLSSSMPNLSYNKILNETQLSNGITISRTVDGSIDFSATITNVNDLLIAGASLTDAISDGVNTSVVFVRHFDPPFELDSRDNSFASITISDDLRGLISFTGLVVGKTEPINIG